MLKFKRDELLSLIDCLGGSVDNTGGFPILENIFLNGKYAYSYNRITGTRIKFNSQGLIVLIPFKKFSLFLKSHSSEFVEMLLEDTKLKVKIGKSRSTFIVQAVDEYPSFNDTIKYHKKGRKIKDDLLKGIRLCLPFVSMDQTRPNMNGIFLKGNMVVGTDGRRIGMYKGEETFVDGEGVIIPIEMAKILVRLKTIDTLYVGKNKIVIKSDDIVIFSTIISDKYPPVEDFIPNINKFIDFPSKVLNESLKKVWDFSDESKDYTFCTLKFKKYIEVSYDGKTAFIKEKVNFKGTIDISKTIKVNPFLFQSILASCDKFSFIINDENKRDLIYGETKDGNFKCILMIIVEE